MSKTNLNAIKEHIDPKSISEILDRSYYPKPRWMVNESVRDHVWKMSKLGFDPKFHEENIKDASSLSFARKVAPGELLTDQINLPLLTDIQNSLLYLDIIGKVTRPKRISDILIATTHLIFHTNELRHLRNEKPIRSLEMIKFVELKDYLHSFSVDRKIFDTSIELILDRWKSKNEIDWEWLRREKNLTTREFASLKNKLVRQLSAMDSDFGPSQHYTREFEKANERYFDVDFDLFPKEKTISNEISKLEALNTARPAQKYKFRHTPRSSFSSGRTIFEEMLETEKTSLMPVQVSLHALSSALQFARIYGRSISQYISDLDKFELNRILELDLAPSTSMHYLASIKEYAYKNTQVPTALRDLNITSWGGHNDGKKLSPTNIKHEMSVCSAVKLYTAAVWILLASFTAGRTTSLQTLRRDCFRMSPVDGLFDIVMRIPKSSERLELEEVHRPIPDLIYDYGLDFASLACALEQRRGYSAKESSLFLFGGILSSRSMAAYRWSGGDTYKFPLSDDYVNEAIAIFQDWSDSPLINGKRWYPATHQFRRLFAVLYFNFSDEIGLEELSWFMGHSNLDQTFHYAEVAPTDDWIEEAESTIARIGASLHRCICGDNQVMNIIDQARETSTVSTVLEPLIHDLIEEHKKATGQQIRFCKIENEDVFFYFTEPEGQ